MSDDLRQRMIEAVRSAFPGAPETFADAVLAVRDEELERLRVELAEAKAERDTNFSLVGRLSAGGFARATQFELIRQERDALKAELDTANQILDAHRHIWKTDQTRRQQAEATIERVRADCEAQKLGDNSHTDRKTWELGVWAQAQRVLRILNGAESPAAARTPATLGASEGQAANEAQGASQ